MTMRGGRVTYTSANALALRSPPFVFSRFSPRCRRSFLSDLYDSLVEIRFRSLQTDQYGEAPGLPLHLWLDVARADPYRLLGCE